MSLIKWPGGKARLAPLVEAAFGGPCRRVYLEPLLGGASVYLYRRAQGRVTRAVLSDVNPRLVNLHRVVQQQPEALIHAITQVEDGTAWKTSYAQWVQDFNRFQGIPPVGDVDLALRFLWLNRTCFNGLYRENRKGWFNSPPGVADIPRFPSPEVIRSVSQHLRGSHLYVESAFIMLQAAGAGDQVYCDPPYIPLSLTASFVGYSADGFGLAEQHRLALEASAAVARGARVVISNSDTPTTRALYPGWDVQEIQVKRTISAAGASRGRVGEVILSAGPRD